MKVLFVYGTLMCEEIIRSVVEFVPRHRKGTVKGYRRLEVKGVPYPGIIEHPGHEVDGLVYFDIDGKSWERLDLFEGDMYARRRVEVSLEGDGRVEAEAYVVKGEYANRLEKTEWSFAKFLKKGKKGFIEGYAGFGSLR